MKIDRKLLIKLKRRLITDLLFYLLLDSVIKYVEWI